ncbi:type II toxin-antitoxin system PemK/MazF family toxin [Paenibacillus sp. PK4536]|uniref:type II toxin-antitoxin system PemK/MazF family toxin n=1 Tax=Paenibacillus sp. PK4536 TaxID=3024576 RepID=UPI00235988CE|nr:type II toxin-antitoxin system PemK/MazF family toxin [Paenibacillus sp. PK4536]WIM40573.1 type II toxin-antitoxin system PemK/MazF family toxin [Paenibacillus sp. PK4536]
MEYIPSQGDIIYLDFNPTKGHEQAGHRPAVVVSNNEFHRTGMMMVVPVTNTIRRHPLHVHLNEDSKIKGEVMCEQMKSLDYKARSPYKVDVLPPSILEEVIELIKSCF